MYTIQYQTPTGTHSVTFEKEPSVHQFSEAMTNLRYRPHLCALVLPPMKKKEAVCASH